MECLSALAVKVRVKVQSTESRQSLSREALLGGTIFARAVNMALEYFIASKKRQSLRVSRDLDRYVIIYELAYRIKRQIIHIGISQLIENRSKKPNSNPSLASSYPVSGMPSGITGGI